MQASLIANTYPETCGLGAYPLCNVSELIINYEFM